AICGLAGGDCGTVVPIAAAGSDLGAAVEAGGRLFVPDYGTGHVWIVDPASGRVVAQPKVLGRAVRFELLNRDGIVFFNDPASEPQPADATTVWNFGDGQTATGVRVTHHWTAAKSYPITVTAKFPGHPDSSANAIVNVIGPAPAQLTVITSGNGTLTGPGGL